MGEQNQAFSGSGLLSAAGNLYNKVFAGSAKPTYDEQLLKEISDARRDWQQAESIFNETTDTVLIDHAIYDMMAAKTRYSYLVKIAKDRGISSGLNALE